MGVANPSHALGVQTYWLPRGVTGISHAYCRPKTGVTTTSHACCWAAVDVIDASHAPRGPDILVPEGRV